MTFNVRHILSLALISASVLVSSCLEETSSDSQTGLPAMVTVSLNGFGTTKATGIDSKDEDKVKSVQVLLFNSDGTLDGYSSLYGSGDIPVSCSTGEGKTLWALVNSEDMSDVVSLDDFLSRSALLEDNEADCLQMTGSKSLDIVSVKTEVEIEVSREVAKITVNKIRRDTDDRPYLTAASMKIKSIYVINAAGEYRYGGSQSQVWFNKSQLESGASSFVADSLVNFRLKEGETYSESHSFYVCPNAINNDTYGGDWSPRRTRLVVEVEIDGVTCWYPVTFQSIEANRTYTIDEMVITRRGSSGPDTPVPDGEEVDFSITVNDWEVSPAPFVQTI